MNPGGNLKRVAGHLGVFVPHHLFPQPILGARSLLMGLVWIFQIICRARHDCFPIHF